MSNFEANANWQSEYTQAYAHNELHFGKTITPYLPYAHKKIPHKKITHTKKYTYINNSLCHSCVGWRAPVFAPFLRGVAIHWRTPCSRHSCVGCEPRCSPTNTQTNQNMTITSSILRCTCLLAAFSAIFLRSISLHRRPSFTWSIVT